MWNLVQIYSYSPVVGGDGFVEFCIKDCSSDILLAQICNVIINWVHIGLASDDELPKISKELLERDLKSKINRLLESTLIIPGYIVGEIRISPGRLFAAIDPDWIHVVKKIS